MEELKASQCSDRGFIRNQRSFESYNERYHGPKNEHFQMSFQHSKLSQLQIEIIRKVLLSIIISFILLHYIFSRLLDTKRRKYQKGDECHCNRCLENK